MIPRYVPPVDGSVQGIPVPDADADGATRRRRDLKAEANSTRHLLTHTPFNKYCDACNYAKLQEKSHRKGAFQREVRRWGGGYYYR